MVSSLFATSLLLSYYFKPEVLEHMWFTGSKGSKASLHVIRVGFLLSLSLSPKRKEF